MPRENTHREDISWAFADWEGRDKIICNISDPGSDQQKTDERHVYALENAPGGDNPHFNQPEDEPENGAGGEVEPDTPESGTEEGNQGPIDLVLPAEFNNPPAPDQLVLQGGGTAEGEEWEVEPVRSPGGTPMPPDQWPNPYFLEGQELYERDTWIHPDWRRETAVRIYCETAMGFGGIGTTPSLGRGYTKIEFWTCHPLGGNVWHVEGGGGATNIGSMGQDTTP